MAKGSKKNKKLSILGFLVLTLAYLGIIKGVGYLISGQVSLQDGKLDTISDILWAMIIPLGAALLFVYVAAALLGWIKPVLVEKKRVRRWVWIVPIIFIIGIALGINYSGLDEKGIGFILVLLLATQIVGWGEEGMFRGIGVTTLRQYNISEGKVALWSSAIFGLVHIANALGGNPGAIGQAFAVMFAGYFFYLIRRVSGSNILNSILHGLFDFMLITSVGILVTGQEAYVAGAVMAILVYLIVGIILLVRRHNIEPAK